MNLLLFRPTASEMFTCIPQDSMGLFETGASKISLLHTRLS